MKSFILPRYILREHIGPFFFGFSVITLIFLLNLLFRELSRILSKGLPWNVVVEFFALNMAWIVALAVPMAVLVATLMAFGRLSADNEITAMKSNGISLYRIAGPVLLAAAGTALVMVWFNNAVLPDFNHRARLLAGDIARKQPGVSIEPGVWYDQIPNFGLLVQELEDSSGVTKAVNLLIDDHSDPERSRTISARRGYIELSQRSGALILTLFDGEMQELDIKKPEEFRRVIFAKHVLAIAVDDMFLRRSESEYRGDREKSARQMRQEVAVNRQQVAEMMKRVSEIVARDLYRGMGTAFGIVRDSLLAQTAAISSSYIYHDDAIPFDLGGQSASFGRSLPSANPPHSPFRAPIEKLRTGPSRAGKNPTDHRNRAPEINLTRQQRLLTLLRTERQTLHAIESELTIARSYERSIKSLLVEIHKKYSIPVACIVFVLIGAPMGVMARRGGIAMGGGLSLGFFLLYWTFLIGGEDLADRQIISPFLAMWSANLIVGAAGLYLFWRAAKETITLDFTKLWQWVKK